MATDRAVSGPSEEIDDASSEFSIISDEEAGENNLAELGDAPEMEPVERVTYNAISEIDDAEPPSSAFTDIESISGVGAEERNRALDSMSSSSMNPLGLFNFQIYTHSAMCF